MKIGRNDQCPCGSGKKYKYCCLGKEDNPYYSDINKFPKLYKETRKEARIKECLYPDKSLCSERIVSAHSIQNNKILSKIADNGKVYMPCPKPDFSLSVQNVYGRKEATVFTGFCSYHDKIIFQAIEDCDFSSTVEQVFLFIYRAFALEYHKKREAVRMNQILFSNKPSAIEASGTFIRGKTGFEMSVSDFEEEKQVFDKAILSGDYDVLTSIIWTFDGFSNYAATGAEAPEIDFMGKRIQDLRNPSIHAHHIYYCVFPWSKKTYAIIAWLKQYDDMFKPIKEKLLTLSDKEKKNYINNTLPYITENIVVKPSSWDQLHENAKTEFVKKYTSLAKSIYKDKY